MHFFIYVIRLYCIFHSRTVSENGNLNLANLFLFGFLLFSMTALLQLGAYRL